MTREKRRTAITAAILMLLAALACGPLGGEETTEVTKAPPPAETPAGPGPAEGRCGDGVCDGPENEQNCPEDCAPAPTLPAGVSEACLNPNPHHAIISEELTDWYNWLQDGGFEEDVTEVEISDLAGLSRAAAERSQEAARTGSHGYAIVAGSGEGVTFSIRAYIDKGEDVRFSFWARSVGGEVEVQPTVYWVELGAENLPPESYTPDNTFAVGSDWTQISFVTENTKRLRYALLSIEVGPDTTLHIDDVAIEGSIWRMAEYEDSSRIVGGIPVPLKPAAPVNFTVLIHIEDPPQVFINEEYFWQQTAIMRGLAEVLHDHGGSLTIQPEEDWVMASDLWHPSLLAEMANDLSVVYSTHTHGPHCRDDEGRLRSSTDCQTNRDTPGWDQSPTDHEYPYVVEYVRNLRDLIEGASGTRVTDHNGNWEFDRASTFAEIPMLTWSSYKSWRTQRTYDVLINNPWRPAECNADREIERFITHDPGTEIVYIPGWGQVITRFDDRLLDKMRPMVSQFIHYADPDRVNTFYVITHVGTFHAQRRGDDAAYITYDTETDELAYGEEFQRDLQYWNEMLSELIDPLVAEGYLQWASLPEMGELYLEWEKDCGLR